MQFCFSADSSSRLWTLNKAQIQFRTPWRKYYQWAAEYPQNDTGVRSNTWGDSRKEERPLRRPRRFPRKWTKAPGLPAPHSRLSSSSDYEFWRKKNTSFQFQTKRLLHIPYKNYERVFAEQVNHQTDLFFPSYLKQLFWYMDFFFFLSCHKARWNFEMSI